MTTTVTLPGRQHGKSRMTWLAVKAARRAGHRVTQPVPGVFLVHPKARS